jgi:hypothetical protein
MTFQELLLLEDASEVFRIAGYPRWRLTPTNTSTRTSTGTSTRQDYLVIGPHTAIERDIARSLLSPLIPTRSLTFEHDHHGATPITQSTR